MRNSLEERRGILLAARADAERARDPHAGSKAKRTLLKTLAGVPTESAWGYCQQLQQKFFRVRLQSAICTQIEAPRASRARRGALTCTVAYPRVARDHRRGARTNLSTQLSPRRAAGALLRQAGTCCSGASDDRLGAAAARAGAERPAVASAERRAPCHGQRGLERQHRQSAWREVLPAKWNVTRCEVPEVCPWAE